MITRDYTRRERIKELLPTSKQLDLILIIPFLNDISNLGLLIRSAVAFGFKEVWYIGKLPEYKLLNPRTASSLPYIKLIELSNPSEVLNKIRLQDIKLYSIDKTDHSIEFNNSLISRHIDKTIAICLGNESLGIPPEILLHSDHIHINMPGPTPCINVAMAGSIVMYELSQLYQTTSVQWNQL